MTSLHEPPQDLFDAVLHQGLVNEFVDYGENPLPTNRNLYSISLNNPDDQPTLLMKTSSALQNFGDISDKLSPTS